MTGEKDRETELLRDPLGRLALDAPEGAAAADAALFVYHRDGVQRVVLHPGASVIIGREPPADLLVRDSSLSRQHARFVVQQSGTLAIQDLDSTNGTLINGVRVEQGEMRLGDQVTLGAVTLALHLVSGADGEPLVLESHDRFVARLAEERARARAFARSFALLMIRSASAAHPHVSRWVARLSPLLRAVDHMGLYAADCAELLLPEADAAEAAARAAAIAEALAEVQAAVSVGVCPRDATSVAELIERCREAVAGADGGVIAIAARPGRPAPAAVAGAAAVGAAMREVHAAADRVADASLSVLILGETGAGKEVLARRIHERSPRRERRFCAVNCGAIPPQLVESTLLGHERGAFTGADESRAGVFEAARGGTLFLDEIGELPLEAQASLLRALDTRKITRVGSTREIEIDVRVLAATNRDPEQMVQQGSFRQDLLYRLNSMVIEVPPLRRRRDELPALVQHFVELAAQANRRTVPQIDAEALALLQRHRWPGNVRELRNAIERAVVICVDGLITADDLPAAVRAASAVAAGVTHAAPREEDPALDFKQLVERYEADLIIAALRTCDWNQSAAARRLQMPRRTLVHKMKTLGLRKLGYSVDGHDGGDA